MSYEPLDFIPHNGIMGVGRQSCHQNMPSNRWAFSFLIQEFMPISHEAARLKFASHKGRAKIRGIEFKLTFEQWRAIWGDKLDRCGPHAGQLGMCRIGDAVAYEVGNVYLGTPARNGASRRMANQNKQGSEGRYAAFVARGPNEQVLSDEETDEEYVERHVGMASSSIYR